MEKEKNETESERKSDTSLKGTVIAFIILLILAIAAFLCEKMDNAIFTILMVIISVITFFGTVILAIFSDVYLPEFAVFLEKDHFSLYGEKIQINGCEDLWQYAKKSAKTSETSAVKWLWLTYRAYHKQKKAKNRISIFSFQHLHVNRKEYLSCLLLQNQKKADLSSCATAENQKGEKNKKKEEASNSLKTAIFELLLEIMIFCFARIAFKTQSEKIEILMIILSTIAFLVAVTLWIFSERKQKKTKK